MNRLPLFSSYRRFRKAFQRRCSPWSDGVEIRDAVTETIKISIVDDDESMRESIKTLVELDGFSVEGFSSAEEFLFSNRSQEPACLILDVHMPGMSGVELQRLLIGDNRLIPIIFITARYSDEERMKAIEAGAVDYLQKPFSDKALLNAINSALVIQKSGASGDQDQAGRRGDRDAYEPG
jgi:FixJ family two-component response regulator